MTADVSTLESYKVGDSDQRPWGGYVVTGVGKNGAGEEVCEKDITVRPQQVLSLQSHAHRREYWQVLDGTLTAIVDGRTLTLQKGEGVEIPKGALHAMSNLSDFPVVVRELQEGLCREEDNVRYLDAYGRAGPYTPTAATEKSAAAYAALLDRLGKSAGPA